jgi:hypothetical protein
MSDMNKFRQNLGFYGFWLGAILLLGLIWGLYAVVGD